MPESIPSLAVVTERHETRMAQGSSSGPGEAERLGRQHMVRAASRRGHAISRFGCNADEMRYLPAPGSSTFRLTKLAIELSVVYVSPHHPTLLTYTL
jgi:hypothetical protein